jgi:RimJ/RimL family protein N-acetyltransferase
MLNGSLISLRPVREDDLALLYTIHADIDNRGEFYPRTIQSEPSFRRKYQENGLWTADEGTLVIVSGDDEIVGNVGFFKTVDYLDELELGYHIFDPKNRGKGFASEAVKLLVRYLFETNKVNRIRLNIHPENFASRSLAERCGFRHEGTARGAWYNRGRHHDVEVYAILHSDVIDG